MVANGLCFNKFKVMQNISMHDAHFIQRLDSTRLTVTLIVNLTLKNIVIYKWIKISQKKI